MISHLQEQSRTGARQAGITYWLSGLPSRQETATAAAKAGEMPPDVRTANKAADKAVQSAKPLVVRNTQARMQSPADKTSAMDLFLEERLVYSDPLDDSQAGELLDIFRERSLLAGSGTVESSLSESGN